MIVAKNLSKKFGSIQALDNINFCLNKGDVIALLGANGAGKTTLMRILTGFTEPTEGMVEVYGENIFKHRLKNLKNIGYLPENCPLYTELSVYEYLSFIAKIYKINKKDFAIRLAETAKFFNIKDVINQKIETLSKGYKRRVGIVASLLHQPKVLILDEPTEGLDPNQKVELRNLLHEYGKNNIVIISTHIMEEVEALANRVIVLNKGKLIRDTIPSELKKVASSNNMADAFYKITFED